MSNITIEQIEKLLDQKLEPVLKELKEISTNLNDLREGAGYGNLEGKFT